MIILGGEGDHLKSYAYMTIDKWPLNLKCDDTNVKRLVKSIANRLAFQLKFIEVSKIL